MATTSFTSPDGGAPGVDGPGTRAPQWLVEVVEVLELRRRTLVISAVALALTGIAVAWLLPRFLPPRPAVGAAAGTAAVLMAVAITLALDSVDLRIRGPRHVRSSGGLLASHVAGAPDATAMEPLVRALAHAASAQGRVLVGLAPLDPIQTGSVVAAWQDAFATALADGDLRVLAVDLQRDGDDHPGLADVADGTSPLSAAVRLDGRRKVARLGPGRDRAAGLSALGLLASRLPSDIDVLLALLPAPTEPGVLGAVSALDHVYVLAEVDRSARVDLIAALDAFDATNAPSEVVLFEDGPVGAGGPRDEGLLPRLPEPAAPGPVAPEPAAPEPDDEVEPEVEVASVEPVTEEASAAPVEPVTEKPPAAPVEPVAEVAPAEPDDLIDVVALDDDLDDVHDALRLLVAETALVVDPEHAADVAVAADVADVADVAVDRPVDDPDDEGDPTVETPPVVLDDPSGTADALDLRAGLAPEPFPDAPELPADQERVAVALKVLGRELWLREAPASSSAPQG